MTAPGGRRPVVGALVVGAVLAAAGCAPPGKPLQKIQAAKVGVATSSISAACGYAWELTAYGGQVSKGIAGQQSAAASAARKLAGVYAQSPGDVYQGESVGAVLGDTITLLDECGLSDAERILQNALRHRG